MAVLDGTDVDSGTAAEIGYAFARGKLIVGYRGDFRLSADNEGPSSTSRSSSSSAPAGAPSSTATRTSGRASVPSRPRGAPPGSSAAGPVARGGKMIGGDEAPRHFRLMSVSSHNRHPVVPPKHDFGLSPDAKRKAKPDVLEPWVGLLDLRSAYREGQPWPSGRGWPSLAGRRRSWPPAGTLQFRVLGRRRPSDRGHRLQESPPTCGCPRESVAHLRRHGFPVKTRMGRRASAGQGAARHAGLTFSRATRPWSGVTSSRATSCPPT